MIDWVHLIIELPLCILICSFVCKKLDDWRHNALSTSN